MLAIIARCETYGYEIIGELENAGFEDIGEGTLYPVLTRLDKNKLIQCRRANPRLVLYVNIIRSQKKENEILMISVSVTDESRQVRHLFCFQKRRYEMNYSIMEQQLNGEYRDAFTAVITYGTLKNYSDEIMTERIAELFDTLLTAQTNGKPVGKIIGHNTERFCREFFEDCSNWDMTVKFLQSLFYMSCITFVLVLLLYLTDRGSADGARYNLTPCIIGAAIYFIFSA